MLQSDLTDNIRVYLDENKGDYTRIHRTMVLFDSRHREAGDADNSFHASFERIPNVVGISLESAEIPNTLFEVTASNNQVDLVVNGNPYNGITVPVATYNGTSLALALQTAIEAAIVPPEPAGAVTVSFDEARNYLTITATGANTLSLLAATGVNVATGIWETLGFPATDVPAFNGSLEAPNTLQLRDTENYVYLCFEGLGTMFSLAGERDVFAKVVTDDLNKFTNIHSVEKTYSFSSPLPHIRRIKVMVVRADGTRYNLRGFPMSFSLKITYLN